ncbi:Annexin [Fasciola hepatica]|uniref:Annexin n=1 Tax=Fasciola hepatica TaxID=6192 RepID=A0A4E0RFB1_FASHE|nr:Annexin [Fasciola hepatica]
MCIHPCVPASPPAYTHANATHDRLAHIDSTDRCYLGSGACAVPLILLWCLGYASPFHPPTFDVNMSTTYKGTLTYPPTFNPEADADALHKACKGINTDEDTINAIVGHRNHKQRAEIRETYFRKYQKDLVEVLKSSTKGDYDSLLQSLFRGHMKLLAYDLFKGMKGLGTNDTVLNEIICCCNNTEIYMLKKAYDEVLREEEPKKASTRSLEGDVTKETKPPYETLLLRLLRGQREEDPIDRVEHAQRTGNLSSLINERRVDQDVQELYGASMGQSGKGDPEPFIRILSDRSKYHLKAVWEAYKRKYGTTLVEAISKKFSDPLRGGLNTTLMALVNLRLLLVCQIHESMYGVGTNEDSLIRLVCLRCEIDMTTIRQMYHEYFGKSLIDAVKSDTSGDFRKLLIILLGG